MAKKTRRRKPRPRPQGAPGPQGPQQQPGRAGIPAAPPEGTASSSEPQPARPIRPGARRKEPAGEAAVQIKERAKKARREEARRQREAFRRKRARRRWYRRAGYVLVAVAVIGGISFAVTRHKHGRLLNGREKALLASAPAQQKAAGCGPVQTIRAYPGGEDRAHIGTDVASSPPLSSYPSHPPVSGPHDPSPLDAGPYSDPPPIYQAIHSLEHGAVIVWHPPTASGAELTKLQDFFRDPAERDHVIVAPYNYPAEGSAGTLPAGKQMVLASWHHLQTCNSVSLSAAFDFIVHYRYPAPANESYKGDAPELGSPI